MINSPFNEDGEPIMDAAAWRYEQELDSQAQYEWEVMQLFRRVKVIGMSHE